MFKTTFIERLKEVRRTQQLIRDITLPVPKKISLGPAKVVGFACFVAGELPSWQNQ